MMLRSFIFKKFIAHKLEQLLDEGLEWVLIQGQMGIELWTAEVVIELKRVIRIKVRNYYSFSRPYE